MLRPSLVPSLLLRRRLEGYGCRCRGLRCILDCRRRGRLVLLLRVVGERRRMLVLLMWGRLRRRNLRVSMHSLGRGRVLIPHLFFHVKSANCQRTIRYDL